ncbi:hypothetical protein PX860_04895 [Agrobacterium leguminum]|uniref:hypothetical protein n=1 Tax=Agrobacterium leguminum TaxID=2792015 RepID=UPI00272B5848|nr:hypothetical protein [Agrobacterium leguminum]WLD97838.1 hypothetical protein PX860_04895 [Agrobacterium leguminum]
MPEISLESLNLPYFPVCCGVIQAAAKLSEYGTAVPIWHGVTGEKPFQRLGIMTTLYRPQ